ncbi:hypothetical protein [Syntrophus aciditrophicus]|nr:hypothetical protein [Syntrophus aciditrophicus]
MNYRETLQAVDTEKALSVIGINSTLQGAYVKFNCPECEQQALIKAYGEKKNLWYCPKCKKSGHIISLTMTKKNIQWEEAKDLLLKARNGVKKITEEFNLKYDLQYNDFIKDKGLSEDICKFLEIGTPKGKTMLSGCVAFLVRDEVGMRVAYFGIKMKDEKHVFHKSFNPEQYLYGFQNLDFAYDVYFTTDLFECIKHIENGFQCVCNFGLPYISNEQMELLEKAERVTFSIRDELVKPFALQLTQRQKFYRFIK